MKLAGKSAIFHLSEDGKSVVSLVVGEEAFEIVTANAKGTITSEVEETDDLGVWLRLYQGSNSRYFLLRWEFILGIELSANAGNVVGLRG
jgi:hypothetical protein